MNKQHTGKKSYKETFFLDLRSFSPLRSNGQNEKFILIWTLYSILKWVAIALGYIQLRKIELQM